MNGGTMPISSIQYRLVTENYRRQSKLIRDTDRKISKQYLERMQCYQPIIELKNPSIKIELKKCSGITINKQNKIKTTFLLLMLINQVIGDKTTLLNNPNDFSNLPHNPIDKPNSLRDITKKIPQNFPMSFTNSSTNHESNSLSYKMINDVNKKLFHFLEKKKFLDKSKKNIRKEELICSVFSYFYRGNRESCEIATKILSVFYPNKKERYPFLTIEYTKKILSDWFFKNIIEESPVEYVSKIIANDKRSFSYSINDIFHILSIEKLSRDRKINLNLLSPIIRIFFEKLWFENIKLEMPFFYFWHREKNIGTILLQDLEFPNLYTGAQFLYDFNMLDKFNYREASEIGKKMWEIAIRKGISPGMQDYFLAPSIIFEADYAPQKINKEKDTETIITEQLKYRETVQQLSRSIKNNLNKYKTSLKKWSNKKDILDREQINRITLEVASDFSALDKNLLLFALTSMRSYETSFVFSADAIIRPISFDIQTITRKPQPIITPIVGQICFNPKYKTISCLKNDNTLSPTPNINIFLNKTDLFSVRVENEERIYALKDDTYKYRLFRIDRDIKKYIDADILNYKNLDVSYFISNNKIITREKKLYLKFIDEEPVIKGNITKFINFLVNKHSSNLFNLSFQTDRQYSNVKTGWDILKHFIPFYDCVSDSLNMDLKNALPSCLIDAAVFSPLGGLEFLAEKFSLNLGKSLYKNSIYLEGGKFIKNLPIINEVNINPNKLNLVIKESVGKKYTNELINTLSEDEKTISLSQKLQTILSKKSVSFFPDSLITAYLPNSKITVSVIKAAEKEAKNIYLIVDPRTGNSGWVRYTMEENKELVPLKPFPKIKVTKQLRSFITPEMYAKNVNIDELSLPDYYTGLRWDHDHKNAYLSFKKNLLIIKILDTQPFLVLKNRLVALIYKNNKLGLENLLQRLARLKKVGLSGRNLLPKQVIANKLKISEEEALRLLNKYEFPKISDYYTDKTFALSIKETGEIPQWSEAFKILTLESFPTRFLGSYLQDNNLYSFSHAEGFAYRVDNTPPEIVLKQGFVPSDDYTAIEKMIEGSDMGLIVSGDITGALRYNTLIKSPYIYKIALENIRGVSLKDNLLRNQNGLKLFLEEDSDKDYKTIDSLARDTNGAIYLDEIHLYYPDIKITAISLAPDEEIQQAEPLAEGPWKNYF